MKVTIETLNSVITPDAGHCSTIMICDQPLEFAFYDKSVANGWVLTESWVEAHYLKGPILYIPLSNIRFITKEEVIEDKKEKHTVAPYFQKKIK